ncbi:hypothetical protein M1146_05085 [Patescibacteria group bacterium]|nr:hypothetical protein [Patescibacteria group bacterium]
MAPNQTPINQQPIVIEVVGSKPRFNSSGTGTCAIPNLNQPATSLSDLVCKLSGPEDLVGQLVPFEGGVGVSFKPNKTGSYACQVYKQVSIFWKLSDN